MYYTATTQVSHKYCTGIVQVLHWVCTDATQVLHKCYLDATAPMTYNVIARPIQHQHKMSTPSVLCAGLVEDQSAEDKNRIARMIRLLDERCCSKITFTIPRAEFTVPGTLTAAPGGIPVFKEGQAWYVEM